MKYGTENLIMTEKNIFAYKLFLLLNISDFNLFFYVKIAWKIMWKKSPPLSQQPPLKVEVLSSPSFWKFCFKSNRPPAPPYQQKRRIAYFGGSPSFLPEKIDWCFLFILNLCGIFFLAFPFLRSSDLDTNTMILRFRF